MGITALIGEIGRYFVIGGIIKERSRIYPSLVQENTPLPKVTLCRQDVS